jgi:hypothetical protein
MTARFGIGSTATLPTPPAEDVPRQLPGARAGGRACPAVGVPRRAGQGARKFSQYREGVGPCCPWYLERDPREP